MRDKLEQLRDLLNEVLSLMDGGVLSATDKDASPAEERKLDSLAKSLCDTGDYVWVQHIDDGRSVGVRFFEGGYVNNPAGPATWTLEGTRLTIRWPDADAPGGAWIDACTVSADGKSYEGENQDGVRIRGFLRPMRKAEPVKGTVSEFLALQKLLESESWPEATFFFQVADDKLESDKEERAEGIASIILPPLGGKRFLDFGCGEGHVASFASRSASFSVGYDLAKTGSLDWSRSDKLLLTTNLGSVISEGPYDVILIYDVLDHCEDMAAVLTQARDLLSENGTIFMRCHPWSSRHGGHLYKSINKAFVHLVLTPEETEELGLVPENNQRIIYPVETYDKLIFDVGLKKARESELDTQEVEPFFHDNPVVRGRIMRAFGIKEWTDNPPVHQMSVCFVDYVLKK